MPAYKPLLTTADVAALVQNSPHTVKHWRHQGKGPRYVMVEGEARYWLSDVEAWLNARRSPGRKDAGATAPRYRAASISDPKE